MRYSFVSQIKIVSDFCFFIELAFAYVRVSCIFHYLWLSVFISMSKDDHDAR